MIIIQCVVIFCYGTVLSRSLNPYSARRKFTNNLKTDFDSLLSNILSVNRVRLESIKDYIQLQEKPLPPTVLRRSEDFEDLLPDIYYNGLQNDPRASKPKTINSYAADQQWPSAYQEGLRDFQDDRRMMPISKNIKTGNNENRYPLIKNELSRERTQIGNYINSPVANNNSLNLLNPQNNIQGLSIDPQTPLKSNIRSSNLAYSDYPKPEQIYRSNKKKSKVKYAPPDANQDSGPVVAVYVIKQNENYHRRVSDEEAAHEDNEQEKENVLTNHVQQSIMPISNKNRNLQFDIKLNRTPNKSNSKGTRPFSGTSMNIPPFLNDPKLNDNFLEDKPNDDYSTNMKNPTLPRINTVPFRQNQLPQNGLSLPQNGITLPRSEQALPQNPAALPTAVNQGHKKNGTKKKSFRHNAHFYLRKWKGCTKGVAKYCYKACKKAYKSVCSDYKCSSSMKKSMKKACDRACSKEFNDKSSSSDSE